MKFSEIAVCAGCEEVMPWSADACPSCGDRSSYIPSAFMRRHRIALGTFDDRTQTVYCRGCRERISDVDGVCRSTFPAAEAGPREGRAASGTLAGGVGAGSL